MTVKEFKFESGQRTVLLAGMALGLVCLIAQFVTGDEYKTEFWSSLLQNTVYFTGIAFTAVFFLAANIVGFAGWITTFRRIWEHLGGFLLWMLLPLGLLVAGVWMHFHHLYHWNTPGIADPENPIYDRIIAGKSSFLNPIWYTLGAIGFTTIWFLVAQKIKNVSQASDNKDGVDIKGYKKSRNWAAIYLPLAGFLSPLFYWLLTMSIDPHWYSTMFAWYSMVSAWLGALSLTIMVILYLKSLGYMEYVTREHLHDLGKFLFGISIFWTYLWFDQFMLIWYANNGEETIYFKERMNHYPILYWGNLLMNFIAPFFILMRNDTKRKFGTLFVAAAFVFFGHWWDYFYMVKPGARIAAWEHGHHSAGHGDAHSDAIHVDDARTLAATHEGHDDHNAEEGHGEEAHAAATGHSDGHDNHHDENGHSEAHHPTHFQMGYSMPGFLDLGIMLGFLSTMLFFLFSRLQTASLLPKNDPFLEESLHHATGAHIDVEIAEGGGHHH